MFYLLISGQGVEECDATKASWLFCRRAPNFLFAFLNHVQPLIEEG
jgi:hypothetical protein